MYSTYCGDVRGGVEGCTLYSTYCGCERECGRVCTVLTVDVRGSVVECTVLTMMV